MFWRLLKFILHQLNTTEPGAKRDALHHQRQVILCNSGRAAEAFLEFAELPWNWRSRTQKPILRIPTYALLAALNVAGFGVASIFTSAVARALSSAAIVLGPSCGGHKLSPNTTIQSEAFSYKIPADTNETASYVRQCYRGNITSHACSIYYRPSLNFPSTPNATYPFTSGACYPADKSAFSTDTDLVDSHSDPGSNSRPEHRIKYRRAFSSGWHARIVNGTDWNQIIYTNAGPAYKGPQNSRSAGNGFGYSSSAVYAASI
ncbi:MAG: hypothetical protein M1840_005553 [Geoglossum simile]|nr:MAG: hypothetical protein M1840_005553 [Geoglossum simile]